MVLRRLHQADRGSANSGTRSFSQSGCTDVVGIDHADDLGVGGGVVERQPQRAGLEAGESSRARI